MLIAALAAAMGLSLLMGGKLKRLSDVGFRGWPFYALGLIAQTLVSQGIVGGRLVYPLSFVALMVGVIADLRLPGMPPIAAGLAMNLAAIAANGGRMPVATNHETVSAAGQALTHSGFASGTHLRLLSDVIRIPLPGAHYVVLSFGDILISLGAFMLVLRLTGPSRDSD